MRFGCLKQKRIWNLTWKKKNVECAHKIMIFRMIFIIISPLTSLGQRVRERKNDQIVFLYGGVGTFATKKYSLCIANATTTNTIIHLFIISFDMIIFTWPLEIPQSFSYTFFSYTGAYLWSNRPTDISIYWRAAQINARHFSPSDSCNAFGTKNKIKSLNVFEAIMWI